MNEQSFPFINNDEDPCEEGIFLHEVITALSSIRSNLHGLFSDIGSSPTFTCLDSDLTRLQRETKNLCKNVEFLIGSQLHGTQKEMSELRNELADLRQKYEHLQNEWDSQQEHLGRMQSDLFKVRNQMQQQSQFCASLGAVMGNLVWKASRIPPVVDILLSGNKIGDFLSIVNGSLISFMETYENSIPGQCADESQFIMSMCGIVTNIAAASGGRQFLVNNSNGRDLLLQFSKILPIIPTPSGNCLKRLLLMALYNTSINQNGLKFLQRQKDLLSAIAQDLQKKTTYDLTLMSLRLLQSLTYDIPSPAVYTDIIKQIPPDVIQPMTQCSEPEMKNVVIDILDNISKAQKKYDKSSQGDSRQPKPPCPGGCGEAPSYGTNMFNKVNNTSVKECSKTCPNSGHCKKSIPYKCYAQNPD